MNAPALWMKASVLTANERDTSAKTVQSPSPPNHNCAPWAWKGKAKKEESEEECSLSETEDVPPAPKINTSKRKIMGKELIKLVKDTDDNVKDYVIQNVFMKQDF